MSHIIFNVLLGSVKKKRKVLYLAPLMSDLNRSIIEGYVIVVGGIEIVDRRSKHGKEHAFH